MRKTFGPGLILLALVLFSISCKKNEEEAVVEEPPEIQLIESQTVNLTPAGGSFEINQFKIDIPSGTVEKSTDLVLEVYDGLRIQEGQSSYLLKVLDIPFELNEPITFYIKNIEKTDNPAIATEWLTHSLSADTIAEFVEIHEASFHDGVLSYTLDITEEVSAQKNVKELPEFFQVGIFAVTGYGWVRSPNNTFLINAPVGEADKAQRLAVDLEDMYEMYNNPPYNFSYEQRTKYPIKVNLYYFVNSLSNMNLKDAYGVMTPGFIGVNRHHISINTNPSVNPHYSNYKLTAAHELFHLVQSYYDPREIQVLPSEFWWVEEATAVLMERKAASDPNTYLSEVLKTHAYAPLEGLVAGLAKNGAEHHGYGMSSMFKYLTDMHGEEFLLKVFQQRYTNGVPSWSAIKASLNGQDYSEWYGTFIKMLLQGGIYDDQDFMTMLFQYTEAKWAIDNVNQKSKTFTLPINHMGVKVVKVNAKAINHSLTETASIRAKLLGDDNQDAKMLLFAKYPSTPYGYLGEGNTSLRYDHLKNLADNNGNLYFVVMDLKDDLVNTNPVNYTLEVTFSDGQNEFKMMGFEFSLDAYLKYIILPDSVTYLDGWVSDRVVPLDKFTLTEESPNLYKCDFDITDENNGTLHWTGNFEMKLSEDLITLERFTINITSSYVFPDQSSTHTYSAVFTNLPYVGSYHHYAVEGANVNNHVESMSSTLTYTWDGVTYYSEEFINLLPPAGAYIYVGSVEGI